MRFAVVVLVALIICTPVWAAERGVIIINPDGSVTETDAPKAKPQAAPVEKVPAEPREEAVAPAPAPKKTPVAKPKPAAKAEQPVSEPVEPEPAPQDPEAAHSAAKAKTLEHKPESVFKDYEGSGEKLAPKKPVKTVKPKPAPAKSAKPKTEPEAKVETPSAPEIKWNKPPKASKKPKAKKVVIHPEPEAQQVEPPQAAIPHEPISKEAALRAAIAVAPPFKRSSILPGNYKGAPVYEVILQTEDGEDSILVDLFTGEIVK